MLFHAERAMQQKLKRSARELASCNSLCLNICLRTLTSAACPKELCIWTSTPMYPFKVERSKGPISLILMNVVLLLFLDIGKDRENCDVDDNVRTAITVSALLDKLPPIKFEDVPLRFDNGDEES